jgi:hypothetical protein
MLLAAGGPRFFLCVCGPAERLKLLLNVKALLESGQAVPGAEARARRRAVSSSEDPWTRPPRPDPSA